MTDGLSGGVQQWIIGLASALSKLVDSTDEYLFIAHPDQTEWLTPYLAVPCRLLSAAPPASGPPRKSGAKRRGRSPRGPLGPPSRIFRKVRRRLLRLLPTRRPQRFLSPLDQVIRQAGADVMHFPRQLAFPTTVPSIYQPWDLQHLHLPEFFTPEARQARETNYRAFGAQASLIVVASHWVKDDLVAQYAIEPDRIAVVNPPPVTLAYVAPGPEDEIEIATRLGLPSRFAFYPAQTWGHKNHERLLQALRQLRDRGVDVPLVGSGHLNDRASLVRERATQLGLDDLVRLLGFLSPTEIQVVYRRATLLVFPSLYEGWGLPILEAFEAALPVACSNVTSLPELVGEAALTFDPTDPAAIAAAIERLWLDEELRAGMAARGLARARRFDWHETALLMRALYRRVGGRRLDAADRRRLGAEAAV